MRTIAGVFACFFFGCALDVSADQVEYDLRFEDAATHYLDVTLRTRSSGDTLELMMPVWTPGSYLVREYARHIDRVTARNEKAKPLPVEKTMKNRWTIQTGGATSVVVNYRVYCHEMSVRTNWVEHDFAMLNGASTFVTPGDAREKPHRVRLHLPDHWKNSVCALDQGSVPHSFVAKTHDELVDSPILCGNPDIAEFKIDGVNHALVNLGNTRFWDVDKAAEDVQRIVEVQQKFWGNVPYPRYLFLNMITESGGGLEHDNSTLLMTSRWYFRDREKYENWLSLVSHEFFHTWNVRRLRPAGLIRYDFENENYTHSLWVAEGITNYIEDVFLARAGLIDEAKYLKRFSKNVERLQSQPGRLVQSLAESSYDTWIKFYRPDENSNNTRISYYTKGAIVAFLLDAKIRELTNNKKSIDDVMRLMYDRFLQTGYTDDDVLRVASEVSEHDLTDWFANHIGRAQEVDYQPALDWYGIEFSDGDDKGSKSEASEDDKSKDSDAKKKDKTWLGVKVSDRSGQLRVTEVPIGSPAARAGLNVDDEVLALDGFRVSSGDLESRLKQYEVGDSLALLISRRGAIRELKITVARKPKANWKLRIRKDATERQKKNLQLWLKSGPAESVKSD